MKIDLAEQIEFWKSATDKARTKELALVCFGIWCGLRFAKELKSDACGAPPMTNEKLILENQLAMMVWMTVTGMAPASALRQQIEATQKRIGDVDAQREQLG